LAIKLFEKPGDGKVNGSDTGKLLYLWNSSYEQLKWQKKWELDTRLDQEATLKVFGHEKAVVQCATEINHRDMKAAFPFSQGRHK